METGLTQAFTKRILYPTLQLPLEKTDVGNCYDTIKYETKNTSLGTSTCNLTSDCYDSSCLGHLIH